jgi:vacuolar-type H+-ATPase subunit B/Vma2
MIERDVSLFAKYFSKAELSIKEELIEKYWPKEEK